MIIIGEDWMQICNPNPFKDTYRTFADQKHKDWRREKLRKNLKKLKKSGNLIS